MNLEVSDIRNAWEAKRDSLSVRSRQIFGILQRHPDKKIHNAGPATNYEDEKKLSLLLSQENLSLFLNMQVFDVEKRRK